ncbi:MAG: DUF7005 family protein [Desulfovermiculus sp.]
MHTSASSSDVRVLQYFGADQQDLGQLLEYVQNPMIASSLPARIRLPLEDEMFAAAWREYAAQAATEGSEPVLKKRLIQLNFPIQDRISATPEYQNAVKKGQLPWDAEFRVGTPFTAPNQIHLDIHESPAGTIGVITAAERQDFIALVQALTAHNEPIPVPDSLGAFMVSGYNNWDRIRAYRRQWEEGRKAADELAWLLQFQNLKQRKELYQDRFILLSSGAYSGINARKLGLSAAKWTEQSLTIRLEHECAHYFTRRVFASMRRNIWDEILADYMGITAARGSFNSDLFLLFLGLEDYPAYRSGGRFEKYIPERLSKPACSVLQAMTCAAAEHLQLLDRTCGAAQRTSQDRSLMLLALCLTGWTALTAPDYRENFKHAHHTVCSRLANAAKIQKE